MTARETPRPAARPRGRLVALAAALGAVLSCAPAPESALPPPSDGPESWVKIFHPRRAWSGYTLDLHEGRVPTLIDMNGRVVHSWPEARVKSRARLLADGSLLAVALGRGVVEYDWDGRLTWQYATDALPHHDVIRLANGNTMFPLLPRGGSTDLLVEVDRAGEVVWRWDAARHLAAYIDEAEAARGDVTHINSVQELPDNPWHRRGDERFRPGNLLISARNLMEVFVLDRASGRVTWSWSAELDLQHEALMIEPGFPGAGHVILFNNGSGNRYDYRKSKIQEIDPSRGAAGEVVWEYAADEFFSPTGGVEQPLPNGNVLIGSTRGGRAFEVTRGGDIVWQWVPPFDPVRPARYAYDHCPQLAARPLPATYAVRPAPGYRHVDRRVYEFAPPGGRRREKLDGNEQTVLARNDDCRRLLLPASPTMRFAYGLDRGRALAAGFESYAARFAVRLRDPGRGEDLELFSDRVTIEERRWREGELDLSPWSLRWVELCVATEAEGAAAAEPTEEVAFWSNPGIAPGEASAGDDESADDDLTPEERDARREHLRALGYIQ